MTEGKSLGNHLILRYERSRKHTSIRAMVAPGLPIMVRHPELLHKHECHIQRTLRGAADTLSPMFLARKTFAGLLST